MRLLAAGTTAQNLTTAPTEDEELTNEGLRKWLGSAVAAAEKDRRGEDDSARGRVAQDALKLRTRTHELDNLVTRIAGHADSDADEERGRPYVAMKRPPGPGRSRDAPEQAR